jgi:hypothetical protein
MILYIKTSTLAAAAGFQARELRHFTGLRASTIVQREEERLTRTTGILPVTAPRGVGTAKMAVLRRDDILSAFP